MTSFNDLHVEFATGASAQLSVLFEDGEMKIDITANTKRGEKKARVVARDYDRMIPPYYVMLSPVCITHDQEVSITQFLKYNWEKKMLHIPHEHHRASTFDGTATERILQRAVFSDAELARFKQTFGWIPESRYLNFSEFKKVIATTLPSCYNAARWRLVRKNTLIYEKVVSKLYQFACENISQGMLQRIVSNENSLRMEYIPSRLKARDVAGKVVLPFGAPEKIYNNEYLVMSDTQQSGKAGEIVHLSLGTKITSDGDVIAYGKYPVSWIFAHNPFHRHISPNRQVVARYTTQACELLYDEPPLMLNPEADMNDEPEFRPHGRNLLAARMEYYGYTHEDGCVISKEASEEFITIVKHYDIFKARDAELAVQPLRINPAEMIQKFRSAVNTLDAYVNRGHLGKCKAGPMRSSLQRTAIVTDIRIENGDDSDENVKYIQVESSYPLRLSIGDKLADHHGNKVIVAKILPRKDMPKINDQPVDIIVPPYVGKRCCPSRILEEMYSIYARKTTQGKMPLLANDISFKDATKKLKEVKLPREALVVDWTNGSWYENVGYGWVRYFRLEQHAESKAKASRDVLMDYRGVAPRGKGMYTLADVMFSLYSVNADELIKEIVLEVRKTQAEEATIDHMQCFGFTLEGGFIKKSRNGFLVPKSQMDGIVIDTAIDRTALTAETDIVESELRERTVLDPRLLKSNGYVRVPKDMKLILGAFARSINVPSYDPTQFERNARMGRDKVKTEDVYVCSDGEMYIRVPKTLKAHMLNNGSFTVSDVQNALNTLLVYFQNFEKHKAGGYDNPWIERSMITRSNQMFNMVMNGIAKRLFRKTGIIRMLAFPRVIRSCHAVISGNPQLDMTTCEIPIRLFKKWCASADFRKSYMIPEDDWMDLTTGSINSILKRQKARCLISRNPAHQVNNVAGMRMLVWKGNTIRFNPALVTVFDGDFDGDTMIAYAPLGAKAKADLSKIWIAKYFNMLSCSKALKGLKISPRENLMKRKVDFRFSMSTGTSENWRDIRDRYSKEKNADFNRYMKGRVSIEHIVKGQAAAAAEFRFMKEGAANAGNIGNIMRNIMVQDHGRVGITYANDLYHSLAQPALNSKNSEGQKATLDIVTNMLRSLEAVPRQELQDELSKLVRLPETAQKVVESMFKGGKWQSGVSVICARTTPVAHSIMSGGVISLHRAAAQGDDGSIVSLFLQMASRSNTMVMSDTSK